MVKWKTAEEAKASAGIFSTRKLATPFHPPSPLASPRFDSLAAEEEEEEGKNFQRLSQVYPKTRSKKLCRGRNAATKTLQYAENMGLERGADSVRSRCTISRDTLQKMDPNVM